MPTNVIVCGAAGRMGRTIIGLIPVTKGAALAGAIEAADHSSLGTDAGAVAGIAPTGIAISENLAAVAGPETVVLDFTSAEAALQHLRVAVAAGSAIVLGSTGFSPEQQAEVDRLAPQTRAVVAANMSIGITLLQRLAREAAMALGPDFDPEIIEIHHRQKVDAPSGTALALGRTIADATGRDFRSDAVFGREGRPGPRQSSELGILAVRGGDVVGDHTVIFAGMGERIELTHRAHSRECLARGALRAALWIAGRPVGRYAMSDVLGLR